MSSLVDPLGVLSEPVGKGWKGMGSLPAGPQTLEPLLHSS